MDIIFLGGLTIETLIGIYDWERQKKQTIVLDIEMAFHTRPAAVTDAIADTLDYKAVTDRVTTFVENSEFFLIEKLVEEIATLLRTEFGISWLRIKLNKGRVFPHVKEVGIVIERGAK